MSRETVASRHLDWAEPYDSAIHLVPLWDEEHALTLGFRDGQIVSANDEPFRLEDGHLLIPDQPGNGIEWDEDAIERYRLDL